MIRKILKKTFSGKFPRSKKEEQEFGPGKKDLVMCPDCNAVYYEKSWHHNLSDYEQLSVDKAVTFQVCPADRMKKDGQFEGELVIENIPAKAKREIVNLIKNIAERAHDRDVLDRILHLKDEGNKMVVHTSENQMAHSMGKQVHKAHKQSKIDVSLSKREDPIRVRVWWE